MSVPDSPRATAIVADDEPLLRAQLKDALAVAWPSLEVVAEAANGAEAVHAVREHRPAVAFLDIEMPVMNGLEAARLAGADTHVVFVTAYDRYAVEAFERGAIDYVLKPAAPARLAETVKRIQARLAAPMPAMDALVAELARRMPATAPQRLRMLQASTGSTVRLIDVDDVLYFQSDTKYTRVVTREGESLVKKTLKELLAELDPERFWQVHRATVVNVREIAAVTADELGHRQVELKGHPDRLEVSRSFAHLFRGA
ncbi:MAG: DNA-binding response regulator [Betaproteobacteria bacterium]|nr:MAG: DNA-binding response regulator [Betaproteobacteria bacterium]